MLTARYGGGPRQARDAGRVRNVCVRAGVQAGVLDGLSGLVESLGELPSTLVLLLSNADRARDSAAAFRVLCLDWSQDFGFELIEANCTDADAGGSGRDKSGVPRVVEALEATMWSSLVMKGRDGARPTAAAAPASSLAGRAPASAPTPAPPATAGAEPEMKDSPPTALPAAAVEAKAQEPAVDPAEYLSKEGPADLLADEFDNLDKIMQQVLAPPVPPPVPPPLLSECLCAMTVAAVYPTVSGGGGAQECLRPGR